MSATTKPLLRRAGTVHEQGLASGPGSPPDAEVLIQEARRRGRRRRLGWFASGAAALGAALFVAVGIAGAPAPAPSRGSSASRPGAAPLRQVALLDCAGRPVVRPASFVISCADGNSLLASTRWTSWSAGGASGVTRFGLNLCEPTCAASRITYFPRSRVTLSDPVATRRGRMFSKLLVTYEHDGKKATFPFTWTGEPGF